MSLSNKQYSTEHLNFSDIDDGFKDIIEKIMAFPGLLIEICGRWVWVSDDTKKYRQEFGKNGLGLNFAPKKKMWYWRPEEEKSRRSRGNVDMDSIRRMYGSVGVNGNYEKQSKRLREPQ